MKKSDLLLSVAQNMANAMQRAGVDSKFIAKFQDKVAVEVAKVIVEEEYDCTGK